MTSPRAVSPAMDPPSFPDPVFYPARRIHGLVETPELGGGHDDDDDDDDSPPPIAQGFTEGGRPPLLQRHKSVTGNVLLLQHVEEGTKAFLLQRKVGTSAYGGSMRVGFCLQGDKPSDEDGLWHVVLKDGSSIDTSTAAAASNESSSPLLGSRKRDHAMMQEDVRDRCELVTVYIESETTLSGVVDGEGAHDTDTLKTELAALQWIANQSKTLELNHLWGCTYMGNESGHIFAILSPFYRDGTLLDYCASYPNGTPPIEEAKFFFNQVLQGLQQLKLVGICHRSISLDTILLQGRHCRLAHYGSALRIPSCGEDDNASTTPHLISPQPVGGRYPEVVAPELWAQQAFDGYAVDLWSVGIVLWKMVVRNIQLFAAPVQDDFRFRDYCLQGKMKDRLKPEGLPDHVVDLLEGMLRVNPNDRYTLGDVQGHSWLVE